MGEVAIKFDEADIAELYRVLGDVKNAPEKVMSRALNKTLSGVKTDISTEIRKTLNASKAAVDATLYIHRSATSNLSGSIQCTGKPLALIDFLNTRQVKAGVSVQVNKNNAREILPGAFIATMKSGHKGVFWRENHGFGGGKGDLETAINRQGYAWSRKTQRYIPMAALPKKYRLPIEELYAPRVPDYLGDKGPVLDAVLVKADERLHTNIGREMDYELSKLK